MSKTFTSQSWFRVADTRPRLRSHAQIHRHRFRGQTWYVLQDHHTGQFHRVSPSANLMICLMDGRRTMQEIWERVCQRFADNPPTQDETIRLLYQLHAADLLRGDVAPDLAELSHRSITQKRRNLLMKLRNPLALRFPLFDPDRFLEATAPLVRPFFSLPGMIVWLGIVFIGIALAVMNWPELTAGQSDRILSAENIALMLIAYPFVKALHELGHGYAAKVWGGEVHEFGIMLLVFIPVPYVDASASSAFREKSRRAVVGAVGIMVELMLASFAMIFWASAEPGLAKAFAFNVMLIGSVSTLLFNGNPLLRFDGYYVLADILEIPNLGSRANTYILYLIQRYLFGRRDTPSPVTATSERGWFVCYGIAAFLYRITISLTIAAFVATKFFVIGVLLAIWTLVSLFVWPLLKGARFVLTSPQLRDHRIRALGATGATVTLAAAILFFVPLPFSTVVQGVVSAPTGAAIRTETPGTIARILARPDSHVEIGQPLFVLEDPLLVAHAEILENQLRELELRLDAAKFVDRVQAHVLREQIAQTRAALDLTRKRLGGLTIQAHVAGRLAVPRASDLAGRYVPQGKILGYVLERRNPVVRVLVPETDVDLIHNRTERVEVRFAGQSESVLPAALDQQVPAAVDEVLDPAFTTTGGGTVVLDPSDSSGRRPLERLFQFDVVVSTADPVRSIGGHAYVRFSHDKETIAWRLSRTLRQLFLRQFDV